MTSSLERGLRDHLRTSAEEVVWARDIPPALVKSVRTRRRRRAAAASAMSAVVVAAAGTVVVNGLQRVDRPDTVLGGAAQPGAVLGLAALPSSPLTAREGSSAVWTGREALIWGGSSGSQAASAHFGDGAAYDPVHRSWRPLPAAPLSARSGQLAVWTGTEMILWGGTGDRPSPDGLRDGAAYDPMTRTWHRIAPSPVPGRWNGRAFMLGGRVVFAGGLSPVDVPSARSLLSYDPAHDTWEDIPNDSPVLDAASTPSGVAFLTLGADGDRPVVKLLHADLSVSELPALPGAGAASSSLALLALGQRLTLLRSREDSGEILRLPDVASSTAWQVQGRFDAALVQPGLDLVSFDRRPVVTLSDGEVLAVSRREAAILDTGSGVLRRHDRLPGLCGFGSAWTWTGSALLVWGGQSCSGAVGYTANGVSVTVG